MAVSKPCELPIKTSFVSSQAQFPKKANERKHSDSIQEMFRFVVVLTFS